MRRLVDANVIIRYLLGDISAQAEKARNEINRGVFSLLAACKEIDGDEIITFDKDLLKYLAEKRHA